MTALSLVGSAVSTTARTLFFALGALVFLCLLWIGYGVWRTVPLPSSDRPAFALREGEWSGAPARRQIASTGAGQRVERLVHGTPDGVDEYLSLSVASAPKGEGGFGRPVPSLRELTHRDPETRALIRASHTRRWELATRFGLLDAADITLDIGGRRNCVTYRSRHDGPLYIEGQHCPEPGVSVQPTRAACLVHAVQATRPLAHPPLDRFMAAAHASPAACASLPAGGTDFAPRRRRV